jgi:uncharacterized protein YeaO (DUF488 family)
MMLKTKSVWSPKSPGDGLRVLATRFRGRGMPKSRYDVWIASLGPSESLLRGYRSWAQFKRDYTRELFADGHVDRKCRTIKNHGQKFLLRLLKHLSSRGNVTLMCHCDEDQEHCHRHVLREIILSGKV